MSEKYNKKIMQLWKQQWGSENENIKINIEQHSTVAFDI